MLPDILELGRIRGNPVEVSMDVPVRESHRPTTCFALPNEYFILRRGSANVASSKSARKYLADATGKERIGFQALQVPVLNVKSMPTVRDPFLGFQFPVRTLR